MKPLKEYLLEVSILGDIDDQIEAGDKKLLNIPSIKDFEYNRYFKCYNVYWQCPIFIDAYLDTSKIKCDKVIKSMLKDITGIECTINDDRTIDTSFIDSYGDTIINLHGIGDWVSKDLRASKKACIEFFQKITENPKENLQKIIDCHNISYINLENYGYCDNNTFNKILNY